MEPVSRRSFLSKGSLGAVGAIGALSAGPLALAGVTGSAEPSLTEEEVSALTGPLFVHVRDVASGEIEVLVDEASVVFKDPSLVARMLRASK